MQPERPQRLLRLRLVVAAAATILLTGTATAEGLLGALIGTVRDGQGTALPNAAVTINSPAE